MKTKYNESMINQQSKLGMALRDEGMDRANENSRSWHDRAIDVIRNMPTGEFMGEDIHRQVEVTIGDPHHPNAYGALIMTAIRWGLIVKTGEYRKCSRPSAHARTNPVYFKY